VVYTWGHVAQHPTSGSASEITGATGHHVPQGFFFPGVLALRYASPAPLPTPAGAREGPPLASAAQLQEAQESVSH